MREQYIIYILAWASLSQTFILNAMILKYMDL